MKTVGLSLTLLALICGLGGCKSAAEKKALAEAERAKVQVATLLRDPASAQWGGIWYRGGFTCGYVNGRNGFGGYAGSQRFFTLNGAPYLEHGALSPAMFEQTWSDSCSTAEYTLQAGVPAGPTATGPLSPQEVDADIYRTLQRTQQIGRK